MEKTIALLDSVFAVVSFLALDLLVVLVSLTLPTLVGFGLWAMIRQMRGWLR